VDTAGIACPYCSSGDVRINPLYSNDRLRGRVEVCVDGSWGVTCSDFFDDNDAMVICRQLGYSPLGTPHPHYPWLLVLYVITTGSLSY
jgi:deleted-in-malignant-brain-tumors protein 1